MLNWRLNRSCAYILVEPTLRSAVRADNNRTRHFRAIQTFSFPPETINAYIASAGRASSRVLRFVKMSGTEAERYALDCQHKRNIWSQLIRTSKRWRRHSPDRVRVQSKAGDHSSLVCSIATSFCWLFCATLPVHNTWVVVAGRQSQEEKFINFFEVFHARDQKKSAHTKPDQATNTSHLCCAVIAFPEIRSTESCGSAHVTLTYSVLRCRPTAVALWDRFVLGAPRMGSRW